MKFSEQLNIYLSELNCTSKKLSEISGISESVISRYRSGERTPSLDSAQLLSLCRSLEELYSIQNNKKINKEEIFSAFKSSIEKADGFNYEAFSKNLSLIIKNSDDLLSLSESDFNKVKYFAISIKNIAESIYKAQ